MPTLSPTDSAEMRAQWLQLWESLAAAVVRQAVRSRSQGKSSAAERTKRGVGRIGIGRRAPASGGIGGGWPFRPLTNSTHVTNTTIALRSAVELPYHSAGANPNEVDKSHPEIRAEKISHDSNGTAMTARRSWRSDLGDWRALRSLMRLALIVAYPTPEAIDQQACGTRFLFAYIFCLLLGPNQQIRFYISMTFLLFWIPYISAEPFTWPNFPKGNRPSFGNLS